MTAVERSAQLTVGASEAFSYFVGARTLATIFAADRANVEAREGGPFELFWSTGDSTEGCVITGFEEGRSISAQFSAPTQHEKLSAGDGTISVRFEDGGDGSTVKIRHDLGDGGGEASSYFEKRWEEWTHNLQVLASSDQPGDSGMTEDARFDLSSVELSRVPNLVAPMLANVADQA